MLLIKTLFVLRIMKSFKEFMTILVTKKILSSELFLGPHIILGVGHSHIGQVAFQLNNVPVVLEIQKKLLFVSQFTNAYNCCLSFYPWRFIIKDLKTSQVIHKGSMVDGLYPISSKHPQHTPVGFTQTIKPLGNLWHAWLGHPNFNILHLLFQCLPRLNKTVGFCESCNLGKSTKLSFQSRGVYAHTFIHTLHIDGRSPMAPAFIPCFDGFSVLSYHSWWILSLCLAIPYGLKIICDSPIP